MGRVCGPYQLFMYGVCVVCGVGGRVGVVGVEKLMFALLQICRLPVNRSSSMADNIRGSGLDIFHLQIGVSLGNR